MMSDDGQYGIIRVVENASGNEVYKVFYTVDRGQTWSPISLTLDLNISGLADELSNSHRIWNKTQLAVANNGLAMILFPRFTGNSNTRWRTHAKTTDLTAMTPTLTDTPTVGAGAGIISASESIDQHAKMAYDKEDLSFVIVANQLNGLSTIETFWFTNGGNTYLKSVSSTTHGDSSAMGVLEVTGTSGSHRIWTCYLDNNVDLYFRYANEADVAFTTIGTVAGTMRILDGKIIGDNFIVLHADNSGADLRFSRVNNLTGSPAIVNSNSTLSLLSTDGFNGTETSNFFENMHKTAKGRIKKGPLSNNHILFCTDLIHPDSVRRPHVFEVQDITAYQGVHQSETGAGSARNYRNVTINSLLGQSFTANTSRYRTFIFRGYQNGTIASGLYTLNAKLYATSAGIPTGAALYTSTNSYDPSKLTKSTSGQDLTFNFDGVSLTNGVVYAVVLDSDMPINASNFLTFLGTGAGASIVGSRQSYDGSVWTAQAAGDDLYIKINGDFETDLGNAVNSNNSLSSEHLHNMESQIEVIDSNQLQFVTRKLLRPYTTSSDNANPMTGHPYRRVINMSNSLGTQSTYTDLVQAAYSEDAFDPNLVYNVSFGGDDSLELNMTTGASLTFPQHDRSGWNHTVASGTS
ncbi:MAG: hypothetical protein HC836_49125, partial [Richelia sp. RM2_1_2]|nr:hypothetical protein [Richelia sp. RM2_1_2]